LSSIRCICIRNLKYHTINTIQPLKVLTKQIPFSSLDVNLKYINFTNRVVAYQTIHSNCFHFSNRISTTHYVWRTDKKGLWVFTSRIETNIIIVAPNCLVDDSNIRDVLKCSQKQTGVGSGCFYRKYPRFRIMNKKLKCLTPNICA